MSATAPAPAPAADETEQEGGRRPTPKESRGEQGARWSGRDRATLGLMLGIPLAVVLFFIVLPTVLSVTLAFTRWNGIGPLSGIELVGLQNFEQIFTIYPPFWPAIQHNVIWLLFFLLISTPLGLFFAILLDKEIRFTRFYQSALFIPVVLSLALVGFIWQLIYAPEQGLLNSVLGRTTQGDQINWLGNRDINLWAVLVAASWRHVGYVMVLYLAGLKSVDPSLKEAAAIDGASQVQTFTKVVFPTLKPINIVILVITVIEALRAFDIVYVINGGTNGLELLSVLVTNNIIGEASRVGYGSALAVMLLLVALVPIVTYLSQTFKKADDL